MKLLSYGFSYQALSEMTDTEVMEYLTVVQEIEAKQAEQMSKNG